MKKNLIVIAAFLAAAVGCVKETDYNGESGYTISVTSPSKLDSKTTLVDNGDEYLVNWTANDVIVVNGQESIGLTVDANNPKKAMFNFADPVETPYFSVYPNTAYVAESLADGTATVKLPAEQTYYEDNFDPTSAIMIGTSEKAGKLVFKHAVAYMSVTVTTADGAKVKSVSIKGNAKETMSGEFTANFAESTLVNEGKDGSSITATCEAGFASGKNVIIAIPARKYEAGVSITLTDVNGHSKLLKSTKEFNAAAGVVYSTEMELKGTGIYGINDYIAFAEAVKAGNYDAFIGADGEVNLMADITLEAGNFKYVDAEFNGVFDGNGHTLTGLNRTTPLFNTIGAEGVVKNLNTAGTFTSFANGYWCGASSFAKINLGLIENCNNSVNTEFDYSAPAENGLVLGCFVGQNGGTIKNCKNTGYTRVNATLGTISANTTFSTPCIAGGFAAIGHTVSTNPGVNTVGYTAHTDVTPGKFVNCVNEGELKITVVGPARKTTVSAVGGICGLVVLDGVEFNGCSNSGNISRISNGEGSNDGTSCVGGILGQAVQSHSSGNPHCVEANKGYNTTITNCTNSGTILHNARYSAVIEISGTGADGKAARHATAGGIVGLINGRSDAKATVTGCTNSGIVTDGWSGQRHFVGGISGYSKNATFTNNIMTGRLESYQGSSIGVAGGIVGAAYDGVTISGGSSKPSFDCAGTSNVDLCAGLVIGVSLANVSVSDMTVGVGTIAKITNKGVESTITKENYKVYNELVSTTTVGDNTNYATVLTNVTWVD